MNYIRLNQAKALIVLANIQTLSITFLIVGICLVAGSFISFSGSIISFTHEFSTYERIFFLKSIRTFEAWHNVIALTAIAYALVTLVVSRLLLRYGKVKTAVVVSFSFLVALASFDITIKGGQKLWELESGTRYNDVSSITHLIQNLNLTSSLRDDDKIGHLKSADINKMLESRAGEEKVKTDEEYGPEAASFLELMWLNAFLVFINGGAVALFLWRSRGTKIQTFRPVSH
jgi:hypothetical protein